MKCSSKSRSRTRNARHTRSRPVLELLESRLQPGSIITGQSAGWSILADSFSVLEQTSSRSGSVVSETPSENTRPAPSNTPAEVPSDNLAISVSAATATRNEPFSIPGLHLVDPFAALNDDLSLLTVSGRPNSVPVVDTIVPTTNVTLTGSAPASAGLIESPIGVATPPASQPIPTSEHGTALTPVALTPMQLPMPTVTSIASSFHAANLQATRLQAAPISGEINPRMTMQNFSTFIGSTGQDSLAGVAVDGSGNIYVAGSYEAPLGTIGIYVASLNSTATRVHWIQTPPGSGSDQAHGIAVSDDGAGNVNVYVAGTLSNGDPVSLTDGFVIELNGRDGSVSNIAVFPNTDLEGVALDPKGNVFVSGYITDPNNGAYNLFTAALDSTLDTPPLYLVTINLQDANMRNAYSFAQGAQSIAVDSNDNTYIMGMIAPRTASDISPVVVAYNGFNDPDKRILWQPVNFPNPVSGAVPGSIPGGIVYQNGSIYVTSSLFDNSPMTTLNSDLLLAKLDAASGTPTYTIQWMVTDGMPTPSRVGDWSGNGIVVNAAGEAIVTGGALDPIGNATFPATKGVDVHVTHFGADGKTTQLPDGRPANTFGGMALDVGNAVVLDPNNANSVLVVGMTQSSDFPTTPGVVQPTYGGGLSDGFLASVKV